MRVEQQHRFIVSTPSRGIKLVASVVFFMLTLASRLSWPETYAGPPSQNGLEQSPSPPTKEGIARGLDHYDNHCASCHGAMGKADIDVGRTVGASDLTSKEVQSKSDADLFRIISNGVSGTSMPAFGKTHTSDEIRQIVSFIRKLPTLTPEERKELESYIPPSARHKHGPPQPPEQAGEMSGEMPGMHHEHAGHTEAHGAEPHEMSAMISTITGGPFKAMQAIGSGTSLLPASAPASMWHWRVGDWMLMVHGDLKVGFNHQGGPRGVNKAESENWLMIMAERQAGRGRLMLRGMFSGEPATAPRRGFPELFQTGETYKGRPLIDAQHPHDLFMELAAGYTLPLSERVSIHFYGGPVAEPTLGPVAFMHRVSAAENPAAPLGHHWQDSTHITHGVITTGVTMGRFRAEGSVFHGAEPDEDRTDIELGKLDSWSARLWFTPTRDWSLQISHGHLVHPEALVPGNLSRTTASIAYNRPWRNGSSATSVIWGRNHEVHGNSNSYLLESTANFFDKNYLYTRLELVDKFGLLEENIWGRPGLATIHPSGDGFEIGERFDQPFRIGAFTFGGVRDVVSDPRWRVGVGADVTFYHVPGALTPIYGSSPTSFHLFLRFRPGKMGH